MPQIVVANGTVIDHRKNRVGRGFECRHTQTHICTGNIRTLRTKQCWLMNQMNAYGGMCNTTYAVKVACNFHIYNTTASKRQQQQRQQQQQSSKEGEKERSLNYLEQANAKKKYGHGKAFGEKDTQEADSCVA